MPQDHSSKGCFKFNLPHTTVKVTHFLYTTKKLHAQRIEYPRHRALKCTVGWYYVRPSAGEGPHFTLVL